MPRTTIHYYLREGLLPQPQKTAGTRSLYSEEHVELLRRIAEAKATGRSLPEIRADLQLRLKQLSENKVDLEAQEYEHIHQAILRLATKEFVQRGYQATRLADLIRRLGISSSVFYAHFPTKHQLWMESFCQLLDWSVAYLEPKLAECGDVIERMLTRSAAGLSLNAINVDMLALVNTETLKAQPNLLRPVRDAEQRIMQDVAQELETMRGAAAEPLPIPSQMLAYILNTAFHGALTRAVWDSSFSLLDFMRTNVWLWLTVRAALSGRVDVGSELANYEDHIRRLVETPPPVFPDTENDAPDE